MPREYTPSKSIKISELGINFDINCCINPMCCNFGRSWHQSLQDNQAIYRIYRLDGVDSLICKKCNRRTVLRNNESLDKIFLWTLKNHLLHEYCPDESCKNYRVNFYENKNQYNINFKKIFQVNCKLCNKRFTVGTPSRLAKKNLRQLALFQKLVCNNTGPRGVIDILETNANDYYSSLHNLSALTKAVSAYYLMQINNSKHLLKNGNINLYTDIFKVSIHSPNNYEKNHDLLDYIITSTDCNGSFVIIAATPAFMPDSDIGDTLKSSISDARKPVEFPVLDYQKPLEALYTEDNRKKSLKFCPINIGGYYIRTDYALIAHFLLLRKMLSNTKHIRLYSDAEPLLQASAKMAFIGRIKDKTCDIVVVNTKKGGSIENKDEHYDAQRNIDKKQVYKQYKDKITKIRQLLQNNSVKSYADKKLWINDPKPPFHEQHRRFLWITRQTDEDIDYEIDLYKNGKLQPIDMPFGVLRKTASFSTRPANVSSANNSRGYDSYAELPKSACDEVSINLFYWNFQLRHGSTKKLTRGHSLGISPKKPISMKEIINWREGIFDRLKQEEKWLGI